MPDPYQLLLRIDSIRIGNASNSYYEWKGIDGIPRWEDTTPWVHIMIPGGAMVHQHILSPHVVGEIVAVDLTSMITALYSTTIDNAGHKAIEESKKYTVGYLAMKLVTQDGTVKTVTFTDFKVEWVTAGPTKFNIETRFIVHFTADSVAYS